MKTQKMMNLKMEVSKNQDLELISSIPKIKFCILYVVTLPVEPFCSQSPSKFQHFPFVGQNLTDVPIWSTNLKLKLITIIVAGRWFL